MVKKKNYYYYIVIIWTQTLTNYTIDEIFSIMKVNKECKLEELYDATKNIMKKLEDSNKENIYEYKHFFRECFKKIIFKQGLSVPDYIYKSLGIIKLDNKLPRGEQC